MNDLFVEKKRLEAQLNEETNFLQKLELKDRILEIERELGEKPDTPLDFSIDCIGCGS